MIPRAISSALSARRIALAVLLGGLAFTTAVPTATAAPVSLTANYTCNFPLLGPQPMKLTISSDIPATVPVGAPTGAFPIRAVAEVSAESTRGLRALEGTSLDGSSEADATISLPGGVKLPLKVPVAIEGRDIPESGAFSVNALGETPSLSFPQAGAAVIDVGDVLLTLTPKLADGTPTGVETFESECAQVAGQPTTLATIQIGETSNETVKYGFTVKGTSALKTLTKGNVNLSGGFDAELTLATGAFKGDLTLNQTRARLISLGFIPVTADLAFVMTSQTTGKLEGGVATATARFKVRLPKLYLFGSIPIAGGATCQTKTASVASMTSAAGFNPIAGGRLTGTYALSDLTGCGALTSFISPLTKGAGNTIDINLTPKA